MEPREFAAGLQQRGEEALRGLAAADRIQQQAYLHPGAGALDQRIAQGGAALVRVVDVVLEVDMVAGAAHRLQQGFVGRRPVHQQVRPARGARRQAGGGLAQPRQLAGIGVVERRHLPRLHPRTRATQPVAPDPQRAEQLVDHQADIGQRGQPQQPAEGGHRLALLQHDPHAQPDQVGDPAQRQVQADVRDRPQGVPGLVDQVDHRGSVVAAVATATG